jgi:16S rRNA A1518/A1519 N6-dimethyltransferase RsmA/KsgA/DIM1 with predicted DNA glycosylase/AP lyase activity
VESDVVEITLRPDRPDPARLARLGAFLEAAFHNRRKKLVNSLSEAWGEPAGEIAAALGLPENRQLLRAERFAALELDDLARKWADSALGERHRP